MSHRVPPQPLAFKSNRTKRVRASRHLDAIRHLPCCVCGTQTGVEAAHLRGANARFAKPMGGMGLKPDDCWATPLCADHHRLLPESQHGIGEERFWKMHSIDPFVLALALWQATGDNYRMTQIVLRAKNA